MVPYTIVRTARKTVGIYIKPDATVEVRAPLALPQADIERLVAEKEGWIVPRLAESVQRQKEKNTFRLNYGDTIQLCGHSYPLYAREGGTYGYDGECFYLPPDLPPVEIKQLVVTVYKYIAKDVLGHKVAAYAPRLAVKADAVKINSAKTHWGSCSNRNSLNFSWRLIMADEDVVDYVVVHELAHIVEHNHSPEFWALVESIFPDYRQRKQKLKQLHDKLVREDWD